MLYRARHALEGANRAHVSVLAREQDRFFYWLPVLFGGGVAVYFGLPDEPTLTTLALGALAAVGVASVWRDTLPGMIIGGVAASACLGLLAAKAATEIARAPVIERELRRARVLGWVELVEPRSGGGDRLTIRVHSISQLQPTATPRRMRVRVLQTATGLAPGDAVSVVANLLPPAGPALPGAYDFARIAWFMGLGAVGSARTPPEKIKIDEPIPLSLRLWGPVERVRQTISRRITMALSGEPGAIAAALITGERGGISEATNQAYRDSGIFHVLSISGLHMTIFAGAIYFACRFLLSLVPILALRHSIKKWAAIAGLIGTFGYLVISGGSPPAVRSAVMLSVMFLAVLMDRPAVALRNVAIAALIILVASPASLIDVGFQMSFAAVVALVAGIEAWRNWRRSRATDEVPRSARLIPVAIAFLGTIILTTIIATASVAPFAAYHFHKSTQYGLLANLVAVPICNLVAMPAALATLIAMPFGLEHWPLAVMGWGVDGMTWVAYRVAALPGAVVPVPAISGLAFGAMICGGLWLCLWGERWRLLGVLPIGLGLAVSPIRDPPDVLVGAGGTLVAIRGADGRLAFMGTERSEFEAARWLEHDADTRQVKEARPGRALVCDTSGCLARTKGAIIAIARYSAALMDDCQKANLVVWLGDGRPPCGIRSAPPQQVLIHRIAVKKEGTHAILIGKAPTATTAHRSGTSTAIRIKVHTVAQWRGTRPWAQSAERALEDNH